jgi:hypothetical protein
MLSREQLTQISYLRVSLNFSGEKAKEEERMMKRKRKP